MAPEHRRTAKAGIAVIPVVDGGIEDRPAQGHSEGKAKGTILEDMMPEVLEILYYTPSLWYNKHRKGGVK